MPKASEVISTYVPKADAERIRARASAGDRTVAAEIRRALRAYLNDERRVVEPGAVKESPGRGRRETG